MVISGLLNSLSDGTQKIMPSVSIIVSLCSWIIGSLMTLGVVKIGLKIYNGEAFEIAEMFTNYQPLLNYLLASILYIVAVILGLVLLIIPGIIIAIRMSFYVYLMVDKNMNPVDALKESWKMTKGSFWRLFLFSLLTLGVIVLGILALLVGVVVAVPVVSLAYIFIYKFLEDNKQAVTV
jgi:uncharacterized membrane protein